MASMPTAKKPKLAALPAAGEDSTATPPPTSPPASTAVAVAASKRSEITAEEKLRVLAWHHANGSNQRRTAAHFRAFEPRFARLNQGTVSRWLLAERRFHALVRTNHASVIREKTVRHPEVERSVRLWLDRLPLAEYARLTGKDIKSMARRVYEHLEVPAAERLELSNGWLSRFQTRHGLKLQKFQGDAYASSDDLLIPERHRLQRVIAAFLTGSSSGSPDPARSLNDVWNMGETSFFFACSPVLTTQGASEMTRAVDSRLTVTLASNATGSERLEPLFIGHESQPRCFEGKSPGQLGFQCYCSNSTAWMTADVFCVWLQAWNRELVAANRRVLLLLDKFRGHTTDLTGISNIQLTFFSPLVTERMQPCSVGLSDAFHALYRRSIVKRATNRLVNREEEAAGIEDLFEIDQLEAMKEAKAAWQRVEAEVVVKCWRQTQILPISNEIPSIREGEATSAYSPSQGNDFLSTNALDELQQALDTLSTEIQTRQLPPTLLNAAEFAKLDLEEALGSKLSVPEIVVMAREEKDTVNDSGDSKLCAVMTTDKATPRSAEHQEDCSKSSGSSLSTSETPALPSPSVSTSPPSPGSDSIVIPLEALNSLEMMETHWRATGLELPTEMQDLLLQTRTKLQLELTVSQSMCI
ncbi:hypothetical protein BBJ28_00018611 [Nothophytophthora sp. Chile5]|nr:hypothetical protein BBJ28_00018611 [Nothophytophthora sp. Chile5]